MHLKTVEAHLKTEAKDDLMCLPDISLINFIIFVLLFVFRAGVYILLIIIILYVVFCTIVRYPVFVYVLHVQRLAKVHF